MTDFDEKYYATHADELGWGQHSAELNPERAKNLKRLVTGPKVLDVGCATGVYVDYLSGLGLDGYGVDFVKDFINQAQKTKHGTFVQSDAYGLPFEDKAFDTVLLLDILEHLDDVKALKEAKRVARQRIIIAVPTVASEEMRACGGLHTGYLDTSHLRYYSPDMLHALAQKAGLTIASLEGAAPFAFKDFIYKTISFKSKLVSKVFFKLFFVVLRLARQKTYYSEWLVTIDLWESAFPYTQLCGQIQAWVSIPSIWFRLWPRSTQLITMT